MLAFILGLLKVIGIVLLIILLLILLLLAIVLFVPIRYKGSGVIDDTEKNVQFKITWLLHALSVRVNYQHPEKPSVIIKILGIQIGKKKKKSKKKKDIHENPDISSELSETDHQESGHNTCDNLGDEYVEQVQIPQNELTPEHQQIFDEYIQEKQKPKESLREKINKIIDKIKSIYDKIKDIFSNIQYYLNVVQEKETKELLHKVFESLLKILKSIRPRKLVINANVGFDTPDTTGKMYGAYWVMKPVLGEHVDITPDFENKTLEGDFFVKGKITVFVIAINGLKILLNKNLKPVIKKFKDGGPKNGGEK